MQGKQDAGKRQETQQVGKEQHDGVIGLGVIGKIAVAAAEALALQLPEMLVLLVPVIGGQAFAGNQPQEEGVHCELVPVDQLVHVLLQAAQQGQRAGQTGCDKEQLPQRLSVRDLLNHHLRQEGGDHRHQAVDQDNQQAEKQQLRTALPGGPGTVGQVLME